MAAWLGGHGTVVGILRNSQRHFLQILFYIFYVFSKLGGWEKSSKTREANH